MHKSKGFAVIALFSLALSFMFIPASATPAHADVIGPTECFPAVLMLKGSGEGMENGAPVAITTYAPPGEPDPYIVTNGHEGAMISGLLKAFVDETDPAETVSKVRFIGIESPSLPVFPNLPSQNATALYLSVIFKHMFDYNDSYRTGAQQVVNFIKADQQRGCETQYMLVSYSQGVISARLAMNLLNNETDKIISSYAIGDPFQKANGVTTSRQFTAANTSPHTSGIGSVAAATLAGNLSLFPDVNSLFNQARDSVNAYYNEMNRSNDFMYRDEGGTGPVSRSLCHLYDTVCSVKDMDIAEHTNYFDAGTPAGAVDLSLEVAEFDKQVQTLANSTISNPRQRVLTKTPSITGGVTSYNVANTRPDDLCSWDENSDGTQEIQNVPCEVMNFTHTSLNPKMTVTVTDSFGIDYVFGSDVEAIDQNAIDVITGLDPDSWYQIRPYSEPEMCIEQGQAYTQYVEMKHAKVRTSYCAEPPHPTYAYDADQVFKASPTGVDNEVEISWGYDDELLWSVGGYDSNTYWKPGYGELSLYPAELYMNFMTTESRLDDEQKFVIKLLFIEDNVPYYIFRQGEKCLTNKWSSPFFETCDYEDEDQWFSANVVTGNYGALSIERDITPPTNVEGLHIVVNDTSARLEWDYSTDGRASYVNYRVVRTDVTPNVVTEVNNGDNFLDLGSTVITPNSNGYSYEVQAKDFAGWYSVIPATITFPNAPLFAPPADPVVTDLAPDGSSVTLNLPSVPPGLNAEIQGNWENSRIVSGTTFTDTDVAHSGGYMYRYRIQLATNVYSEWSESLYVETPYIEEPEEE